MSFYEYAVHKTLGVFNFVRWLEWPVMERWLAARPGERVLDAACGRGTLALRVARTAGRVYGFDIAVPPIRRAHRVAKRANVRADFLVADAEHLPFKDTIFDKLVSSSSVEHFSNGRLAIAEMARVLRRGKALVLTTDSLSYPLSAHLRKRHQQAASVVRFYTQEEISEQLAEHFDVRRTDHLINSPISTFFYRLGIRLDWGGTVPKMLVWLPLCLFAYPVSWLGDRMYGHTDRGYTIIVEAVRRR